ncbi:MAG: T9SS type A sorting domain-containing protein [Candidatus Kapaibacterium sp.]
MSREPLERDYEYITIGCFDNDLKIDNITPENTNIIITDDRLDKFNGGIRDPEMFQSYYFIDDVSIEELPCDCAWLDGPSNTENNSDLFLRNGMIRFQNVSKMENGEYKCCYDIGLFPSLINCPISNVRIFASTTNVINQEIPLGNLLVDHGLVTFEKPIIIPICLNNLDENTTITLKLYKKETNNETGEVTEVECSSITKEFLCKCLYCNYNNTPENYSNTSNIEFYLTPNNSTSTCQSITEECCYDIYALNKTFCDTEIYGIYLDIDASSNFRICLVNGLVRLDNTITGIHYLFGHQRKRLGSFCIPENTSFTFNIQAIKNGNNDVYEFCDTQETFIGTCDKVDADCDKLKLNFGFISNEPEDLCCSNLAFDNTDPSCTTTVTNVYFSDDQSKTSIVTLLPFDVNPNQIKSRQVCIRPGLNRRITIEYRICSNNMICTKEIIFTGCNVGTCCNDIINVYSKPCTSNSTCTALNDCCTEIYGDLLDNDCIKKFKLFYKEGTELRETDFITINNNRFSTNICIKKCFYGDVTINNMGIKVVFYKENGTIACIKTVKPILCEPCHSIIEDFKVTPEIQSNCYKVSFKINRNNALELCARSYTITTSPLCPGTNSTEVDEEINFSLSDYSVHRIVCTGCCPPGGKINFILTLKDGRGRIICSKSIEVICECCTKVSAITPSQQIPPNANCHILNFTVDNTENCFDYVNIIPSLECPVLNILLPINAGISNFNPTICVECCDLSQLHQTVRLEFMKNGVVVCIKEITFPCPNSCCEEISNVNVYSLPPSRPDATCQRIAFNVNNSQNCFTSVSIVHSLFCPPITPTTVSIAPGYVGVVYVDVCLCCLTQSSSIGTLKFFNGSTEICSKNVDLFCGNPTFKIGNETESSQRLESPITGTQLQVKPNPTSGDVTISYQLTEQSIVRLALYDIQGNKILDIENGLKKAGTHTAEAKTHSLPNGSYLIKLNTGEKTYTVPLTVSH